MRVRKPPFFPRNPEKKGGGFLTRTPWISLQNHHIWGLWIEGVANHSLPLCQKAPQAKIFEIQCLILSENTSEFASVKSPEAVFEAYSVKIKHHKSKIFACGAIRAHFIAFCNELLGVRVRNPLLFRDPDKKGGF